MKYSNTMLLRHYLWILGLCRTYGRALAPVFLFALFLVFLFGLTHLLHLNTTFPQDAASVDELRARILWGASFAALGVISGWCLSLAGKMLTTYLPRRTLIVMASLIFVSAIALGIGTNYGGAGAQSLLQKVEQLTRVPLSALTGWMNVAAATTIMVLIVCCVALGIRPKRELEAKELRQRIFDLRVLLFSSAAFLVSGVTEIFFLFDWPRHVKSIATDPLANLAPTISATAGALYTFLLIVIYVPTALIHEQWRFNLQNNLAQKDESLDIDAWRKRSGLETSVLNSFSTVAAILSPLLAAIGVPLLPVK